MTGKPRVHANFEACSATSVGTRSGGVCSTNHSVKRVSVGQLRLQFALSLQ
jgi:hypothetical protein